MHTPAFILGSPLSWLLGSLLCGHAVTSQAATYRIVGASCTTGRLTSSIGPVPLSFKGLPRLGTRFTIVTEGSANYPWGNWRRVTLITGISNTNAGGVRLPLDIAPLFPGRRFCGILRTSLEVMQPLPRVIDYRTLAEVSFTVPNLPSLAGVQFYQQVLSNEYTTFGGPLTRTSLALSAGGEGRIGF